MAFAVRRPVAALLIIAVVAALAAVVLLAEGIRVDDDADVFTVREGRPYAVWQDFQRRFGAGSKTVFGISGSDMLGPGGLRSLEDFEQRLHGDGQWGEGVISRTFGMHSVPFAKRLMESGTPGDRQALRALPLVGRSLIVGDGDPMLLYVVEHPPEFSKERREAWVEAMTGSGVIGRPFVVSALSKASGDQGRVLFPLLGGVAVLALLLLVRSLVGTLLVLGTTIVTLPVTLAVMFLSGHELNLLTNGLPVVLFVLCTTVSLHVLRAVLTQDPGLPVREVARRARREVTGPSFAASLTTAVGFLALTTSRIGPVREMGLFAAIGIIVSWVVALTLLPAASALGWVPRRGGRSLPAEGGGDGRVRRTLLITAATLAFSAVGAVRLDVNSNSLAFLPEDHPVVEAHRAFERKGAPLRSVEVVVGGLDPRFFADPEVMAEVAALQREAEAASGVAHATSVVDALGLVRVLLQDALGAEEARPLLARLDAEVPVEVPQADRAGVAMAPLIALLHAPESLPEIPAAWSAVGSEERDALRDLLDRWLHFPDEGGSGAVRIQVALPTAEATAVEGVISALSSAADRFEASRPAASVDVTGELAMAVRVQSELIESQVSSLLLALVLVALVLAITLSSVRMVLIAAVANVLPLAVLYGGMGWAGIGLDAATIMVGAIALGIAVDDTVHLLAVHDPKRDPEDAVRRALARVRWPVVVTTVMTAAGFSVLGFSEFIPMARFGVLTALGMVFALISDLVVLPALLIRFAMPREQAELLHFTGRGRLALWRVRSPRRWFVRLREAWSKLIAGDARRALTILDGFLADTRTLPETPRSRQARAAASYWRLRCLGCLAEMTADPAEAKSLRSAVAQHRETFLDRYRDLDELVERVERI